MGVSANNYIAWLSQRFSDYLMAHTLANIVKEAAGFLGKVPQEHVVVGQLVTWTRGSMVEEKGNFQGIGWVVKSCGLELPHRQWSGSILNESQIYLSNNNISRLGFTPRLGAQYFFG
jgi:hypothetical protein